MHAPPTFPLLVGGRLRRAAAGRGRPVHDGTGAVVGVATDASRADLADALAAARAALPGWSGTSAQERGRVLHDVAEVLDERRDRLAAGPPAGSAAGPDVGAAVDRWLWYAGWADKLPGAVQPVGGPYVSWSTPRPVGVVGVLAPSLPTLVDGLASALAVGATAVVVTPPDLARAVAALAEVLATSELPPGAANLLVGDLAALAPELARAVDGLDLADAPAEHAELGRDAAARGIAVLTAPPTGPLARLRAWTTTATVWQSVGR